MIKRRIEQGNGRWAAAALILFCGAQLVGQAAAQETVAEQDMPMMTLRACVLIAVEESPTLLTAKERVRIAGKDVTAAWGSWLPDLTLSHTYSKNDRTDFDVEQMSSGFFPMIDTGGDTLFFPTQFGNGTYADQKIESTYKDVAVRANMNLFEGFAKYSRLGSAQQIKQAADATRMYTTELVIQNVAMAYFNLLLFEELEIVATDARELAAKELERTETYFRLGSAAKSDVLQQSVFFQQTQFDLVVASNQVKQAFTDLAYAMNQPLAQRFRVDRSVLTTDFIIVGINELYAEALGARLDLQAREHEYEAAKKDIVTATGNLWPSLDLFLNFTRYNNESPFRFGSQESKNWGYGYQVSWNVFNRLITLTNRGKAKANARIADYSVEQSRLDAQREVRQLYNIMIEAREKANVSRETILQAEEEVRLAAERFRVGAGTTLDQIRAQNNLASGRAEEVRAKVEFLAAEVQMERAVGRFSKYTAQLEEQNR